MSDSSFIPGTNIEKPAVPLVGHDGNAYAIMGRVRGGLKRALRAADAGPELTEKVLKTYSAKSTSGDYDNLLRVAMAYSREPDEEEDFE